MKFLQTHTFKKKQYKYACMHALYEGVLFLLACFFGDCYYVMPLSSLNAVTTSNASLATQDLPEIIFVLTIRM